MAAFVNRSGAVLFRARIKPSFRQFHSNKGKRVNLNTALWIGLPVASVYLWQAWRKYRNRGGLFPAVFAAKEEAEKQFPAVPTYREMRFKQFASVEYEGMIYMTPQDFLESVTEDMPRQVDLGEPVSARIGRHKLTPQEVASMLKNTPAKRKSSKTLFRSMHNKGIISYTEYLFLLCVLTKPHSGFRIAFNMFDTDGNQIVDKKEFLVLESFFTLPPHERKFVPREPKQLQALLNLECVFSNQQHIPKDIQRTGKESVDPIQDTTLLIHFFGPKGKEVLKYDDFYRFMENLQSEVIELEFLEFSKGMPTISETDFAQILLRYTRLEKAEIEECINRVESRIPEEKGISFMEFKQFCQFLNSLDDFNIAMKMYTYAEQAVSQEEFQRAVKVCTGFTLGSHIVDTVFKIFDADGDGHLSYREFISIMKDRMHRGARSQTMHTQGSWDAFKSCVKNQMKYY